MKTQPKDLAAAMAFADSFMDLTSVAGLRRKMRSPRRLKGKLNFLLRKERRRTKTRRKVEEILAIPTRGSRQHRGSRASLLARVVFFLMVPIVLRIAQGEGSSVL